MAFRTKPAAFWLCGALLMLGLAASACTPAAPSPTATPTPPPSATPLPPTATETPVPPSATPSRTPSPSATPTVTATPTPAADFSKIQLSAVENIAGGVRVNLLLPGVAVPYKLLVNNFEYTCSLIKEAPDHLFCLGLASISAGQTVTLTLQDPQSGAQVYSGSLLYAGFFTVTPQGNTYNNCADRGQNVSCETECRQLPSGGYCVVATCTDACGLYFSVNSCPVEMSMDFPSCNADQWAEAKLLYSIP